MSVGPNARIAPDSAYVNGQALPAGWYAAIDLAQYQGIWGDAGGTWNPTTTIRIRGAGIWLCGPNPFNNAAEAVRTFSGGGGITHEDGDYIEFSPALTRSYVVGIGAMGADASYGIAGAGANVPRWQWNVSDDSLSNYVSTDYSVGARLVVPIDMHDGATLATVTLVLSVADAHAGGVPASLPMIRVYQVDTAGNVTQLATNAALPGWSGGGFVTFSPRPGTGAAWYNGGFAQYLTWTADAGVVIDNSRYRYAAEIVDEQGTNAKPGNKFFALTVGFTGIGDLRPQ